MTHVQCNNYNHGCSSQCCCNVTTHLLYTSGFYIVMCCCHYIVTMLYPDIAYRFNITLSFDGPATKIGVHGFTSRQLQPRRKSLLTMLWQRYFVCCVMFYYYSQSSVSNEDNVESDRVWLKCDQFWLPKTKAASVLVKI